MMYNKIEYRGLVKWYDRGLQNLWREFDSLIPCSLRILKLRLSDSFCFIEVNPDPSEALCEDMVLILMGTNKVPEEI